MMDVPKLTKREFETIRHLLSHCGKWTCCGLTIKQAWALRKKLKMEELEKEHHVGGKFEKRCY